MTVFDAFTYLRFSGFTVSKDSILSFAEIGKIPCGTGLANHAGCLAYVGAAVVHVVAVGADEVKAVAPQALQRELLCIPVEEKAGVDLDEQLSPSDPFK